MAIWRWLAYISTQNNFFLWMYRLRFVWIFLVGFLCTIITLRFAAWVRRLRRPYTVGFLHPNCHKKGGGERVLWLAVRSLLERNDSLRVVVYCSPSAAANPQVMYNSLASDLGISFDPALSARIRLVPVRFTSYIDRSYPLCTILFQSLAGIPLGIHCMMSSLPSLFIDTRGCPLSCIAPFFLGCSFPRFLSPAFSPRAKCHPATGTTVAYVHYPTISDDMVSSVSCGAVAPNNQRGGRSALKLAYYHLICRPMYARTVLPQ
jgi:alpha-1,2-mannosyltransferase